MEEVMNDQMLDMAEDEDDTKFDEMYLIVQIDSERYGVSLSKVKEIILLPEINKVPNDNNQVRGVIKLRNDVIKLIDTRKRLGLPSLDDRDQDLIKMLMEKKQDHIDWIDELISAVEENKEFRLTTDPHACKFGKWYDKFETDNLGLKDYLRNFDKPHKEIHDIGKQIKEALSANNQIEAKMIINNSRSDKLKELSELFDKAKEALREARKEIAVIFDHNDNLVAISVDKVDKIINITDGEIDKSAEIENQRYIKGVCSHDENVYIILDIDTLLKIN